MGSGMTKDELIRMAREAGAVFPVDGSFHSFEIDGSLERFAALVAAAEREACARVCERMWHLWLDSPEDGEPNKPDAEDCYRAIRARGTHDQG